MLPFTKVPMYMNGPPQQQPMNLSFLLGAQSQAGSFSPIDNEKIIQKSQRMAPMAETQRWVESGRIDARIDTVHFKPQAPRAEPGARAARAARAAWMRSENEGRRTYAEEV